jgi:hypothetical protein
MANWKTIPSSEKSAATQNGEAKKLMELVVHLATEEQLTTLAKPSPTAATALAKVMDEKREAISSVVGKVLEFLQDHEAKTKPKKTPVTIRNPPPKVANTGTLLSRWKKMNYTKKSPADNEDESTVIQSWGAAGLAMNGVAIAPSSESSSSSSHKRSRIDG